MERRRGPDNHRSGPHLRSGTPIGPSVLGPRPGEEPISPTSGGCFGCGEKHGVVVYQLILDGEPKGHWRLCGPCYLWGVYGLDPDPLYVAPASI